MAEEKKESETVKTPEEVVKEFKTRKDKKTEEYESSFEREAVKALENDNLEKQYETDEELSKDLTIDQKSFSYNVQLNRRIAERLESIQRKE